MRIEVTIPSKLLGNVHVAIEIGWPKLLLGRTRGRRRAQDRARMPGASRPVDATYSS